MCGNEHRSKHTQWRAWQKRRGTCRTPAAASRRWIRPRRPRQAPTGAAARPGAAPRPQAPAPPAGPAWPRRPHNRASSAAGQVNRRSWGARWVEESDGGSGQPRPRSNALARALAPGRAGADVWPHLVEPEQLQALRRVGRGAVGEPAVQLLIELWGGEEGEGGEWGREVGPRGGLGERLFPKGERL